MQFCEAHWTAMRKAVDDRAMTGLIARDGKKALENTLQEMQQGKATADNFDPLMAMHWAIVSNVMRILDGAGINPLILMTPDGGARCPLCFLNEQHEKSCTHEKCMLDKQHGYDWMIERAAQDAYNLAVELKLVKVQ